MALDNKDIVSDIKLPSEEDREFGRVEPWPEPVDLDELLDEVVSAMSQHVYCDANMLRRDALWIVANWLSDHPALDAFPLLLITAPDKGCGKTVYLELIGELVRKPIFAGNITGAALFRVIDAREGPTVLIDEWDSLGQKSKDMMTNLVNNGYRRKSAWAYRSASKDGTASRELDRFRIWGPKVLCGIGSATPTIMSRSHVTKLERKPRNQVLQAVSAGNRASFGIFVRKLARAAADFHDDFGDALEQVRTTDKVGNRGGDNWLPLRAVGLLAGERWAAIADRLAAMFATQSEDDLSAGAELFRDMGRVFDAVGKTRLTTEHIIRELKTDAENRWANYNGYGKPITDRQLAKILRPYGVRSRTVAIGVQRFKGYHIEDLHPKIEAYGAPDDEQVTDLLGPLLDDMEKGVDSALSSAASENSEDGERLPV